MCPVCSGEAFLLGILGKLAWLRCRACGWDFSVPADSDWLSDDDE